MSKKSHKRWDPSLWASKKPFGIGEQRPNNYFEITKAVSQNRGNLRYAWRILRDGVCDGCALGTTGMHDWTLDEVHLCNVRLRLLRLNTMSALDPSALVDVQALRSQKSSELRDLGRLPFPMRRDEGDRGFRRIDWEEALELVADRIRATQPERLGFYLTSRGVPNEVYYVAQKAARALGTNSIDNAARVCHSPSTYGLKEALGVAATTCSYSDWIGTDLIVFIGSNVAANQPVSMKYLYHAKKAGTKVAVVNPYAEPGMQRYWVPSNVESALFGTKIADRFFGVNVGGDIAFINGVLKTMIANGWCYERFVTEHATGFEGLKAALETQSWDDIERLAGASRKEMATLAQMLHEADSAVFVWSMGITQHSFGEDNVRAIINLALSKGFVGREKCGLMPIRGHSGVQGGAEMGAYSTVFPGGGFVGPDTAAHFSKKWGFEVPDKVGLTAPEMIDAGHRGELDVLFSAGGNFLEVLPDPRFVEDALARIPLRVHMDIVMSSQMLVDPAETVLLLPAVTRYEIPGGVTETSTERRIIFSPEIPGPRIAEARSEWEVLADIARRVRPDRAAALDFSGTAAIRQEIADVVPFYDGIQHLAKKGDQVQYGGPILCPGWDFPTDDGKARFTAVGLPAGGARDGKFLVATRRGKQFNSMVHEEKDPLTGARRRSVYMNVSDAGAHGLEQGDEVVLRSEVGEFRGYVFLAPILPGNLQIHWPEAEPLLDRSRRSSESGIPDYNALVTLEKVV